MSAKHNPKIKIAKTVSMNAKASLYVEAPVRIDGTIGMKGFIGAYTYIRYGSRLGIGVSSIGRYCSIAPGVAIGDGQHPVDWMSTHPFQLGERFWVDPECQVEVPARERKTRTLIGNDVWIGANAIIMTGITVGDGAVIGAGAIVTKSVPPYAIVVGAPARVLRYRFPQSIIDELLNLRWWNYTATSLSKVPFDDVELAITTVTHMADRGLLTPIDADMASLTQTATSAVYDPEIRRQVFEKYVAHSEATSSRPTTESEIVPSLGARLKAAMAAFAKPGNRLA